MRAVTFGRWLLPVTALPMAVGAIAFLGLGALEDPATEAAPLELAVIDSQTVEEGPGSASRGPTSEATESSDLEAPGSEAPVRTRTPLQRAISPPVQATSNTPQATSLVIALARAKTFDERLDVLDTHLERRSPERAVALLEGLLDSELPGNRYEAENLRLAAMARLGALPGVYVDATLIARLRPDGPRCERLIALDLLASRPTVGTQEIRAIADNDLDRSVQAKARWVLRRTRGH